MTRTDENTIMTSGELAHLGEGSVAYLREMDSDDLKGKFPGLPRDRARHSSCGRCLPPTASRSCFRTSATGRSPALSKTT